MRSRRVILVMVLAIGLALGLISAFPENGLSTHQFDIIVSGADQVHFSGRYTVVKADGQVVTRLVEGVTPLTLTTTGHVIVAAFQQVGGSDQSLEVHLLKDGKESSHSHSGTGPFSSLLCVLSR